MKAFLIAGVVVPVFLHVIAPERMPWWPDTVSLGIVFGFTAMAVAARFRADREMNRRIWNALSAFGAAIGRHFSAR
jgi:hypothetical protein